MNRRTFSGMLVGTTASMMLGCAGRTSGPTATFESTEPADASPRSSVALYRSVGEELAHYEVNVTDVTLTKRAAVMVPADVQYAWPHPSRQYLYVTSSNSGSGASGIIGDKHRVAAYRILAGGALQAHGNPQSLPSRPIHNSVDASGTYLLIAYNNPSGVTVHRINGDGTIGEQVEQPTRLDAGIFAHQILIIPSNRTAVLVTRGNHPAGSKPEEPGALKLFQFKDGVLTDAASIPPGGGYGFGPRHLDFHPTKPWVYVSVERQNKLHVYRIEKNGLSGEPAFVKDTLAEPHNERPRQLCGAIHVHPNGRFVYVSNRADSTVEFDGMRVFRGGENSIAVFSINPLTGEPTLIQHADTRGIHVRTFSLDPSGRMLVAASIIGLPVRNGARVTTVPAGLSAFRVGADGKLEFVRKYDVETGSKTQFWMGIIDVQS